MSGVTDLNTIWHNIREIDLQNFRSDAIREIRIVLVGESGSGLLKLADLLRMDPSRPDMKTQTPIKILDFNEAQTPFNSDLIIMLLNGSQDHLAHAELLNNQWKNKGKKVIIFANHFEPDKVPDLGSTMSMSQLVIGSVDDITLLNKRFIPLVMETLPDRLLGLGRQFPLFRVQIAHHLINETCFANATYAFGTGLAEVVPVFNLPLTVTDMVVLTKSQAFLVYKLGLVFGYSLEWRDYLAEYGSVIGGAFIWRQLARSLVGLIPVIGIIPKIAVSYSGTYVVGQSVLHWYITGRHLSAQQIRALTVRAFKQGQETAKLITMKMRRSRLDSGKKKGREAIPSKDNEINQDLSDKNTQSKEPFLVEQQPHRKHIIWGKRNTTPKTKVKAEKKARHSQKKLIHSGITDQQDETKYCQLCGRGNAADANYCQYCAMPFNLSQTTINNPADNVQGRTQ